MMNNLQNPLALLAQLKNNPLSALRQAGYNIPQNINSPQAIVQYLMNSGQVSQEKLNAAQQFASQWQK